jgi:membrane-bound ClpP family serine protease
LIGLEAKVVKFDEGTAQKGFIELRGEVWKFVSPADLKLQDLVRVVGNEGLVLKVARESR